MSGRSPRWFTGIRYPYEAVFADNTWEQIISVCQKGIVPPSWKVGDQKSMTIGGTEYMIDIIGKNHDTYASGGKAPLTFQLHDCYADMKAMNSSNTNSGGCPTKNFSSIFFISNISEVSKKGHDISTS